MDMATRPERQRSDPAVGVRQPRGCDGENAEALGHASRSQLMGEAFGHYATCPCAPYARRRLIDVGSSDRSW